MIFISPQNYLYAKKMYIHMSKVNCWEFFDCGREPGGRNVHEFGICPAATFEPADNFCGGKNGGRACVYITGTFCGGTLQGTYKDKLKDCVSCDFYHDLQKEEGHNFFSLKFFNYIKNNNAHHLVLKEFSDSLEEINK